MTTGKTFWNMTEMTLLNSTHRRNAVCWPLSSEPSLHRHLHIFFISSTCDANHTICPLLADQNFSFISWKGVAEASEASGQWPITIQEEIAVAASYGVLTCSDRSQIEAASSVRWRSVRPLVTSWPTGVEEVQAPVELVVW